MMRPLTCQVNNICAGQGDPIDLLMLQTLFASDMYGNNIMAARAGATLDLKARLTHLHEGQEIKDVPLTCGGVATACKDIVGTGLFDTRTDYQNVTVSFGAVSGSPLENGKYGTSYILAAGINNIDIKGNATVTRSEVVQTCTSGCTVVDKDKAIESGTTTLKAYGVEIQLPELPVMVLDSDGLTVGNYEVPYTIVPAEYEAASAVVNIYKDGGLIELIPAEKTGQGFIKFSAGSLFDVESNYEIEVVLNEGSSAEIKTDRIPLLIGKVMLVYEKPNIVSNDIDVKFGQVKELKFSRGNDAKKQYQFILKLNDYWEMKVPCESITASVSVVNKKDNLAAQAPEGVYPGTTISLKFITVDDVCLSVNADGSGNNEFFITNQSLPGLTEREQGVVPVYGGIGNKVKLELMTNNEAFLVKYYPIEPVGVVVIALDGLRQDVLYAQGERSFTPDGNYYVPPSELTGLCEVLGGKYDGTRCDDTRMAEKHVKMKDVTAIFPSITLASWASVFTGSQPKDTGIMGNEFFARDLYPNKALGLSDLPKGMVTLSDGAFGNKSEFLGQYLLPAEKAGQTTLDRLNNSTPNAVMKAGVGTIYQWVGENEKIQELYKDEQYCMAGGECRSAAFYNHYGRGADLWSTMDLDVFVQLGMKYELVKGVIKFIVGAPAEMVGIEWEKLVSKSMDSFANRGVSKFIDEYYPYKAADGQFVPRDMGRRFPALFVVYYAGLDHYAHGVGMDTYTDFFTETTDKKVAELVDKLKSIGEFDNKIFIVVADHGHTAMPKSFSFRDPKTMALYETEATCEYDTRQVIYDPSDGTVRQTEIMQAEKYNNNIHIWELAEMLRLFPALGVPMKVLAPDEIVAASSGATASDEEANIIAALNGPMAHIYVKGTSWKSDPDQKRLGILVDMLLSNFKNGTNSTGLKKNTLKLNFPKLMESVEAILIRRTLAGSYEEVLTVAEDAQGNPVIVPATNSNQSSLYAQDYVRVWERINNLNNKDRSGDIILVMKDRTTGVALDRYTSGVACKSWHGSMNPSDSYVPFIFSYPGGNKQEIENLTSTVCTNDKCNGNWAVTETVKTILEKQFQQ